LGLSGKLKTAFLERVTLTVRDARGGSCTTYLGHLPTGSTPAGSSRVVACLLSFCASTPIPASSARAAA
jgi:hypothetical protein